VDRGGGHSGHQEATEHFGPLGFAFEVADGQKSEQEKERETKPPAMVRRSVEARYLASGGAVVADSEAIKILRWPEKEMYLVPP